MVFMESNLSLSFSDGPSVFIQLRTVETSHVAEYLGSGGFFLNIPFIAPVTSGLDPRFGTDMWKRIEDTAERIVLIVL